ncbi:Methyl-CpG-binding domain-containing protein 4 [Trichinella zimbabwensis]|uniref:Methyl-CpG-binding domain-containing protein 4 n=1 Tax=Trichinella zimbabwensis TaxID=268475 RepID=A0A0V1I4T0_9BILA|nr:Methyl-CpG-binding domain-containing protein 4 [Trichinella zimbabwensis]
MNNTDRGSLSYECIKARHERGDTSIDGIIEELEFLLKDSETVKKQISESLGAPREVLEIYGLALPEETAENVDDDQNLIQQLCLPGTSEQFITQEGWKRELVLRALPSKSTSADVYYISPSGIKFRSSKEVERFASMNPQSMNGLGPENFTFRRYLLGTASPLEYKRDAGFRFGTKAKFARTMEVKIKIENPEIDDNDVLRVNPNVVDSNPEDVTS